jgi:hypothetical protein
MKIVSIKLNDENETIFTSLNNKCVRQGESSFGHYIYFEYKNFECMMKAVKKAATNLSTARIYDENGVSKECLISSI